MSWDKLCKPKESVGVGLRNWGLLNEAMGAKLIWQMYLKLNQKWVKILSHKDLDSQHREHVLTIYEPPRGSRI